jgi:hypothetical protein
MRTGFLSRFLSKLINPDQLHGGHSAAIDDIFRAGDRGRARRGQERDEIRYLPRLCRASDRYAAEQVHQSSASAIVVSAFAGGQLVDQAHGGFGLHPARGNTNHANALRAHLFRQTLALHQMEADGIVRRILHPQVPPKVEYSLTTWGQGLCPALDALLKWAALREKLSDVVERPTEEPKRAGQR